MIKAMCFGTFDILHPGHMFLFKEAKKLADYVIVVVARDKNSEMIKGRKPLNNELTRLKNVEAIQTVDKAILGNEEDLIKVIEEEKPDIICLGYDQKVDELKLKASLEKRSLHLGIVRLASFMPHIYKSSILRNKNEN